jgi:hypothetical protein|tara:strand:- start:325 stop:537 length:213 start_codon:yes stop_codon:yes gene_type:complete
MRCNALRRAAWVEAVAVVVVAGVVVAGQDVRDVVDKEEKEKAACGMIEGAAAVGVAEGATRGITTQRCSS